jgi:hypothetical protein
MDLCGTRWWLVAVSCENVTYMLFPVFFFFLRSEGAPQQMLRTHRSLKAYCATPVMKISSFFYQVLQLMEHQWNEIDRGKPTTWRKTCHSATLSTTNPTWADPGSNPGLRAVRPVTSRLSHGTAHFLFYKRQEPWPAKLLVDSQQQFCSIRSVIKVTHNV